MIAEQMPAMASRPDSRLGLTVCAVTVVVWGVLRLVIFHDAIMPLTYAIPLLICVWTRDKRMLWGMAAIFAAMATIKMWWIMPAEALPALLDWATYLAQLANITIAGLVVHAIIHLRDRLEKKNRQLQALNEHLTEANEEISRQNELLQKTNAELEASNEELAAREEEISRQNEELQAQSEELAQQNEEMRTQGEELEQQSEELSNQAEELQSLNDELTRREQTLQTVLTCLKSRSGEREVLERLCSAGMKLLGPDIIGGAVMEARDEMLHIHAHAGVKTEGAAAVRWPLNRSLAGLVMGENRTAALDDLSLRPDLQFPEAANGNPFRSVLAAPLEIGGTPIGALEFYSSRTHPWSADQFRLAEWMAGQCSSILQMIRLRSELQAGEERFRTLADNISQLVWMADESGSLFWYNRRWYDYTGTTPDEMRGWGWQKVHHPEHVERVTEKYRRHVQERKVWEDTFPLRSKEGEYRWFLSRAVPILGDGGHVTRWFGTNTDITDLRRRQEEIQRLNRTLKALSSSNQAMSHAEKEADYLAEVCRIIVADCGHAMVWIGYAESDEAKTVRPVAWSGFEAGYLETLGITWADSERGRGPTGSAIRTGQVSICRHILTDPRLEPWKAEATRRGYCSSIALPLAREGRTLGALTIYSGEPDPFSEDEVRLLEELAADLAHGIEAIRLRQAKQRIEIDLRQAKETAEAASRAKDHFLAVLSHELRTPLNPAMIAAGILEKSPQLPEELRDDVSVIRRNVELEARLIDDMLDLTRIARGKLVLNRRLIDACEVVRNAIQICHADAAAKGVTIEVSLPDGPVNVDGDPARLQQVFWNLLKNAIKFTPERGKIRIEAVATAEPRLAIRVADSGIGIEPDLLPHIFDAFEQGGEQVTQQFGGLGLGLAITRGLVELHEGRISAASDGPGKGAAFTVALPLASAASGHCADPQRAARQQAQPGRALRILLVEDHESTAKLTARLLRGFGHEVQTAGSVQKALASFEEAEYDLVISDLGLPDGTGCDLMEALTARRSIRAIALSGYGMDADVRKSMAAGFMEHLTKPINMEQLEETIARVMNAAQS